MIYLDNASTTKPSEAVKNKVIEAMELFGNPSSMHRLGIEAEKAVKSAASSIASVLGVRGQNIYFTSGGTESNNTAILGYCRMNRKKGRHIITTAVEHPSVLSPFEVLRAEGFEVTHIGVDSGGVIDMDAFERALRPDTIFVSVMLVNNEVGSIQPVERLKAVMRTRSPEAALHTDAVQGFAKLACSPRSCGIDMLSLSGHKIHAVKGIGALYIADNIRLAPLLGGGGQQKNIRSGTENVPGIAALGAAAEEMKKNYEPSRVSHMRELLRDKILAEIPDVRINEAAEEENRAGHILNVSFMGIKAEILLHSLENHEIYVSTGSACSTHKPQPSHVLTAMGRTREEIMGAVRFSLSEDITEDDIEVTAAALKDETAKIRRYMR